MSTNVIKSVNGFIQHSSSTYYGQRVTRMSNRSFNHRITRTGFVQCSNREHQQLAVSRDQGNCSVRHAIQRLAMHYALYNASSRLVSSTNGIGYTHTHSFCSSSAPALYCCMRKYVFAIYCQFRMPFYSPPPPHTHTRKHARTQPPGQMNNATDDQFSLIARADDLTDISHNQNRQLVKNTLKGSGRQLALTLNIYTHIKKPANRSR